MENKDKYIFIINNYLEVYSNLLKINDPSTFFWMGSIDQLSFILKKINNKISKEKILLVVHKEFINNYLNEIIKIFSDIFTFSLPYILYITNQKVDEKEEGIITKGENFLFILSEENSTVIKENFRIYINLIFQHLVTLERLNSYIVDSFQTIIDSALIEKQKKEIEALNKEIIELSRIDYLTNILNRRAFFESLEAEINRTIRDYERLKKDEALKNDPNMTIEDFEKILGEHFGRFSCILIDIDFFKKINDNFGHIVGDRVLKVLGEIFKSKKIFREQDIIARYGGEEFIVILPETNSTHAKIPAERLRNYIKEIDFYDDKKNIFHITLSMGISEFNITDKSGEELIKRADEALYFAKGKGRDKVIVYEETFK